MKHFVGFSTHIKNAFEQNRHQNMSQIILQFFIPFPQLDKSNFTVTPPIKRTQLHCRNTRQNDMHCLTAAILSMCTQAGSKNRFTVINKYL